MPHQQKEKYRSTFRSWARLSGIAATIYEYRHLNILFAEDVPRFEGDLRQWFNSAKDCCGWQYHQPVAQPDLPFCLTPLWHHSFITLHANLDILERAIGREGNKISDQTLDYVRFWVSSPESKRCLLHALYIQNLSLSTTLNSVVGIHTPRILFAAALCWQCYISYSPWSSPYVALGAFGSFSELSDYLTRLPEV